MKFLHPRHPVLGSNYAKYFLKISLFHQDYNPTDELNIIDIKLLTLNNLIEEFEIDRTNLALKRIFSKYSHIANRVVYLNAYNNSTEEKVCTIKLNSLTTSLSDLLKVINSLKVDPSKDPKTVPTETVVEPNSDKTVDNPSLDNPKISVDNPVASGSSVNKNNSETVEPEQNVLPSGALNLVSDDSFPALPVSSVPNQISLINNNNNCPSANNFQSITPYSSIRNPVQDLVKGLSNTDGLNVSQLLEFLKIVLKIKKSGLLNDVNLFILLLPYTTGPLLDKVQSAIKGNFSFEVFHQDILNSLIPSRLYFQLQQDLFYRLQKHNEPFSFFIQSIKDSVELLRIKVDEIQVVNTIIEGLNPGVRSRLIFESRPKNFYDLEQICISSQNVAYTDFQRNQSSSSRFLEYKPQNSFQNDPNNRYKNSNSSRPRRPITSSTFQNLSPNQQNTKTCFKCGKAGHYANQCYTSRNTKPNFNKKLPKKLVRFRSLRPGRLNKIQKIIKIRDIPLPIINVTFPYMSADGKALIDSGATRSFVSYKFFKSLNVKNKLNLCKSNLKCIAANNSSLKIYGSVILKIKIEKFSWNFEFFVADISDMDIILGSDFINHSKMVIDLCDKIFYFKFSPSCKFSINSEKNNMLNNLSSDLNVSNKNNEPDLSHLKEKQRNALNKLIKRFPNVLTKRLGSCNKIKYEINLKNNDVVKSHPYQLCRPKMLIMRELIDKLLADDVIETSTSSYSSPCFLVPKPVGHRLVIDYRKLNKNIQIESVPLPSIHTAFEWFAEANYFTVLDLNQAYYQIPLADSSKHLTSFCTPWNLYQFKRVPYGLAIGGQALSRLLDSIFHDIKFKFLFHYLDDLVIYSKDFESHLQHISEVLKRLGEANLTVNPNKVKFAHHEISFLGHLVSHNSLRIDPSRTVAIRKAKPPRNVKEIARFIGMLNYFNKFIPNFSTIAAPLNSLRKKECKVCLG